MAHLNQLMYIEMFPDHIIRAERLGGEIDLLIKRGSPSAPSPGVLSMARHVLVAAWPLWTTTNMMELMARREE